MNRQDELLYQAENNEALMLGLLLSDRNYYQGICPRLCEEMFSYSDTLSVFRAMKELERRGEDVDVLSVSQEVGELTASEKVLDWISQAVQSFINPETLLRSLANGMKRRKLLSVTRTLGAVLSDGGATAEEIDAVFIKVYEDFIRESSVKSDLEHISSSVDAIYQLQAENLENGGETIAGIPTGFKQLDEQIGGLQKGHLVIVGGGTGVGKTAFALNIALSVAERGYKVLIVSLEMKSVENTQRFISSYSGLSANQVIFPHEWQKQALGDKRGDVMERVGKLPIYYLTTESGSDVTLEKIRAHVMSLKATHGLDFVIVDYLQLIDVKGKSNTTDAERLEETTKSLKRMAMSQDVPVLALAQLNRESSKGAPKLSHFKGSSSIEQTANIALLLHRNKNQEDQAFNDDWVDPNLAPDETRVYIGKNRNGAADISIKFGFNKIITTFYEKK